MRARLIGPSSSQTDLREEIMIFKILQSFNSLSELGDEKHQQTRLLRVILFVAISLTLVIGIAIALLVDKPFDSLITLAVFLAAEFAFLIITYLKKIRLASFLITFGFGFMLLYITYLFGGVQEIAYSAFVIVILSGGLLLGKRYIWITTSMGIIGGGLILLLEQNHLLPVGELPDPPIIWVANSILFIWSAVILHMALRNIEVAFRRIQEEIHARQVAYDTTLAGWSQALELRDHETEGHSERVMKGAVQLAQELGLPAGDIDHLRRGALLHDIGKMGIPDSILGKPGPLTEEEWVIMRKHPVLAYQLLQPIEFLHPALDIPYCHHEKWDGSGYPRGLKGEEIPLAARIFSIVDVWDAMLSDRPYRRGLPKEEALAYIREQAGKHFDPCIAQIFLDSMEKKEKQGYGKQ
jgi:putative nucleotidyltransferase with HDIG domain